MDGVVFSGPGCTMIGCVFTNLVMVESAARQMARAYLAKWPDLESVSIAYRSPDGTSCSVGVLREG